METQLLLSVELGFRGHSDVAEAIQIVAELQKMLAAIRRKLSC